MTRCLIGSTGFVGTSLQRQVSFDACFHSTDVHELKGRRFDTVVCAAAPAAKWKANKEPEADLANIEGLIRILETVQAAHFILISTVDVFGSPLGVTEDSPVDVAAATAYGRHRRVLEQFVQGRFDATVLRLPGLFGLGLRKNVIYDLLHRNNVDQIHPDGLFQYYDTDRLWQEITLAQEHSLKLLHVSAEPLGTRELARRCFETELIAQPVPAPFRYDLRSKHAGLWGRADGYLFSREQTVSGIQAFIRRSRVEGA